MSVKTFPTSVDRLSSKCGNLYTQKRKQYPVSSHSRGITKVEIYKNGGVKAYIRNKK